MTNVSSEQALQWGRIKKDKVPLITKTRFSLSQKVALHTLTKTDELENRYKIIEADCRKRKAKLKERKSGLKVSLVQRFTKSCKMM